MLAFNEKYLEMKNLFILIIILSKLNLVSQNNKSEAYFASGCFWCVESIYESLKGVIEVESGYSGGSVKNPTYYQVLTGKTGHAEAIKVTYNPQIISFKDLVKVFFASHDPTTLNRQGPDVGSHYRSIAFFKMIMKKYYRLEIKKTIDNNTYKK